jgi:hypothetical protein
MNLPKVRQGLPVGKWGSPDGQDEHWITVDVAIDFIRQHCPDLSHEEAEALLKAAVAKGLVQTRPHETGHSFLRHTDYYQPDIEKLFEEVAATEEPASPVVEQTPAEEAPRARGPKDGKSLEGCYGDAQPILAGLRASGHAKPKGGYLAAANISAEERGVSKKPKGTIEGRPVPEVPPPKTRH